MVKKDFANIPHIYNDDTKFLVSDWVDKIKMFDNTYVSIDQQKLNIQNMVNMFFEIDLLVKALKTILNE